MKEITKEMLSELPHRSQVMFALFCAKQAKDIWKDTPEAREAIETVERWLAGKATGEECRAIAYVAYAAAAYAASYAANAANAANAAAAYAAAWAAYAANAAYCANATYPTYAAYAANITYDAAYCAAGSNLDKTKIIEEQWLYYDNLLAMVDGRIDAILVGET